MRRCGLLALAAVLITLAAAGASTRLAQAAFPGANGQIAFIRGGVGVYVMNADGTGQVNLTKNSPAIYFRPLRAGKALRKANCTLGRVRRAYSGRVGTGRVISQRPAPRTRLARGAKVNLVLSHGKRRK